MVLHIYCWGIEVVITCPTRKNNLNLKFYCWRSYSYRIGQSYRNQSHPRKKLSNWLNSTKYLQFADNYTVFLLLQTLPGAEAVFRSHHNSFIDFLLCYHGNFPPRIAHCITNLYRQCSFFVDRLKEEPNLNAPSF